MANVKMLSDGYQIVGTDLEEFRKANEAIAEITKDKVVQGRAITFLSVADLPAPEGDTAYYYLDDENVQNFLEGKKLKAGYIEDKKIPEKLLQEMKDTDRLLMVIGGEMFLLSSLAIPTLSIRASVNGEVTLSRNNLIRDLHFADALYTKNENIRFVYREADTDEAGNLLEKPVRKVIAAMGSAYRMVPQTILTTVTDSVIKEGKLGAVNVSSWGITQQYTHIFLTFPDEAADMQAVLKLPQPYLPGVYLATSDTGDSSLTVRGVLINGSRYVITDEVKLKHSGNITEEKVLSAVDEKIFTNFRKLPETLAELISVPVMDYSKADLSKKRDAVRNFKAVCEINKALMDKAFGKVVGKQTRLRLLDLMAEEVDGTRPYSMYDIVISFMDLADRLTGISSYTADEIRKASGSAAFVLQNLLKDKKTKEKRDKDDAASAVLV